MQVARKCLSINLLLIFSTLFLYISSGSDKKNLSDKIGDDHFLYAQDLYNWYKGDIV